MKYRNTEKTAFLELFKVYTENCPYTANDKNGIQTTNKTFTKGVIDNINSLETEEAQFTKIEELLKNSSASLVPVETETEMEKTLDRIIIEFAKLQTIMREHIQFREMEGLDIDDLISFDIDNLTKLSSRIVEASKIMSSYGPGEKEFIKNLPEILKQMNKVIALVRPVQVKKTLLYLQSDKKFVEEMYYAEQNTSIQDALEDVYPLMLKEGFVPEKYFFSTDRYAEEQFSLYMFNPKLQTQAIVNIEPQIRDWRDDNLEDTYLTKSAVSYSTLSKEPLNVLEPISDNNSLYILSADENEKNTTMISKKNMERPVNDNRSEEEKRTEIAYNMRPKTAKEMRKKTYIEETNKYRSFSHSNETDKLKALLLSRGVESSSLVETLSIFEEQGKLPVSNNVTKKI
jgi:hypothetical protein